MDILQTQCIHRQTGAFYHGDMTELKTFGERVAWLLKRRRMAEQSIASQKELAVCIGMAPQQLNAYMTGRRRPNVAHLRAIAAALETSVSFLALTSTSPEPDDAANLADDERVNYLSAQADEAALLIDAIRDDDLRDIALDLVRVIAMYDIGDDADPARTGTGGVGGRLILGKLLGSLKKSSPLDRAALRVNSE